MDKNHYLLQIFWSFKEIFPRQIPLHPWLWHGQEYQVHHQSMSRLTYFICRHSVFSRNPQWAIKSCQGLWYQRSLIKSIHLLEADRREVIWPNPTHSILSVRAAVTKHYRLGSLSTTRTYCSQFWRLGSARSRSQHGHVLVKVLSWFIAGAFSLCPHMLEGLCGVTFMRAASYDLITSQRPHLLIPSPSGVKISTYEFWRRGGYKHLGRADIFHKYSPSTV